MDNHVLQFYFQVVCYGKVPSEEQIKDLLRKKNFEEALSLVEELQSEGELTKEMLSFVHAQVGFLLLFDLHFEEAVNHFLLSDTMQPSEVFPFIMRDPNRWSLLVYILFALFRGCHICLFSRGPRSEGQCTCHIASTEAAGHASD